MKLPSRPAIRLRGHHLICLHFFRGEGYSQVFVKRLRHLLRQASNGAVIEIRSGADDVCALCPYLKDAECQYDSDAREMIGAMDKAAMRLLGVDPNDAVLWQELFKRVHKIFPDWSAKYCETCSWKPACEKNRDYRKLTGRAGSVP
jgi:hypothetical protein